MSDDQQDSAAQGTYPGFYQSFYHKSTHNLYADPRALDESLHPRRSAPRRFPYTNRHPLATMATYDSGYTSDDFTFPDQVKLSPPPLDPTLHYKINQRRALMISGYLAVTLPITALILARVFTTTLVPLDPLFDFVVVFCMACILANVAIFAHNHVETVTKDMTTILYKATSVEMKTFREPENVSQQTDSLHPPQPPV